MKAQALIEVLINYQLKGSTDLSCEIQNLTNDSRQAGPGDAFIAIVGQRFDGHSAVDQLIQDRVQMIVAQEVSDYQVQQAIQKNVILVVVPDTNRAQAIMANRFFHEASSTLKLVAVTGTNGKTTTSNMISQLLEAFDHTTGLIGTIHYKIGQTFYPAINTTPDSLTLHRYFAEMVEAGCQDAVLEASSHALALGRLWQTEVDCAIFTNLTREHLDFHQTMDHYAYAKSLLFAQLGEHFKGGQPKLAIVNLDDDYHSVMLAASGAASATYSLENPRATAFADEIEMSPSGLRFTLHFDNQAFKVFLPMIGRYNVYNYLAAFLCLTLSYGYAPQAVIEKTGQMTGVPGRMQVIETDQPFSIVVDFAHTTDALENVLSELSQNKEGKLKVLFGHSGGNRDSAARPDLGNTLFKWADEVVLTADNPRFEPVDKINQELLGDHHDHVHVMIEDRIEAIQYMIQSGQPGDILLFAGKGGESYQVIGDDYVPYDEISVIKDTLVKKFGGE
ncbi:UDP-N-acetylmuramoyl-L-alanyl-D-glutamate--2,6-diaminopimelate ligase [Facklamia languida]|uniref:UDP-N-acetylmuramoyl-L-alanyl-D-glutamate--2,6-diaminopimelate ligase n=1 Tax=Facklamia languida CCUG 37842 TaxID=883113 RepID=H3NH23_9LACT|nr:UDP-N-acetylmuramoyl-L-alanyl-D-glutamate--2,6-diaminopimelate ligase [Facklamia languida]EHR38078.1 UDP-N-acetylmuramyl-tripeptide synthetase [Facklamia languida CCUG 37842]